MSKVLLYSKAISIYINHMGYNKELNSIIEEYDYYLDDIICWINFQLNLRYGKDYPKVSHQTMESKKNYVLKMAKEIDHLTDDQLDTLLKIIDTDKTIVCNFERLDLIDEQSIELTGMTIADLKKVWV